MEKKLHIMFALSDGRSLSVVLKNPKEGLTAETIKPVTEAFIAGKALLSKGAYIVSVTSAYVRDQKDTNLL